MLMECDRSYNIKKEHAQRFQSLGRELADHISSTPSSRRADAAVADKQQQPGKEAGKVKEVKEEGKVKEVTEVKEGEASGKEGEASGKEGNEGAEEGGGNGDKEDSAAELGGGASGGGQAAAAAAEDKEGSGREGAAQQPDDSTSLAASLCSVPFAAASDLFCIPDVGRSLVDGA